MHPDFLPTMSHFNPMHETVWCMPAVNRRYAQVELQWNNRDTNGQ